MQITSARFIKGVVKADELLAGPIPQIALIGRSNAGKSSVINSLASRKNLAKTSSFPGRTQEINVFLINGEFYLIDLPGYGFARDSAKMRARLQKLINWYFFSSTYVPARILVIIDAEIGPTAADMEMLASLRETGRDIIVVANKIDKIKKSHYLTHMQKLGEKLTGFTVIPYSAKKKIGRENLWAEIFK